jgi:DNA ligase-1
MSLYEIVKSLQNAQGSLAKQAILMQYKDNELFKEYMRAVYDPAINYYQKKIPKYESVKNIGTLDEHLIKWFLDEIAGRKVTGAFAIKCLKETLQNCDTEGQELIKLMIDRSIGASVGDTMVLKTWPDLYFTVPYQRCSLLDAKAKEKFGKLSLMYVQEKCDGSFLYLVKEAGKAPEAITRAGSKYPKEFAAMLAEGLPDGFVLIGELLVYPHFYSPYSPCNRQVGNGMLNSILKGGEVDENFDYKMKAWDCISPEEFKAGRSKMEYMDRLTSLFYMYDCNEPKNVEPLKNKAVKTLEEAYAIYSEFTAQGLEGAVLKTPDFIWKDGTSKDCVKMKIEFEIDLKITGLVEGSGKATGMLGALQLTSSCGKLITDVGTGFSDDMRKVFWMHKHDMVGKIVTIKANDIISKRGSDTKSLFLPVFLEERLDKTEADSLEQCEKILASAKGLG